MNDFNLIDPTISRLNETALANILLYSDSKKSASENSKILQSTIKYIIATKRFDDHFSKRHTSILTACYMWCANEIY